MRIEVEKIKCYTILGVYDSEREEKQLVTIDLQIDYDEGNSAKTDDIKDTINYHDIVQQVIEMVTSNDFYLVEKIVEETGNIVMSNDKVSACHVKVGKPEGPVEEIDNFSVSKKFNRLAH